MYSTMRYAINPDSLVLKQQMICTHLERLIRTGSSLVSASIANNERTAAWTANVNTSVVSRRVYRMYRHIWACVHTCCMFVCVCECVYLRSTMFFFRPTLATHTRTRACTLINPRSCRLYIAIMLRCVRWFAPTHADRCVYLNSFVVCKRRIHSVQTNASAARCANTAGLMMFVVE